jgi:Protein of unknown function (DUF2934)
MHKTREQRIRERAYAIWQREGEGHGLHDAHWRQAEVEISAEDADGAPPASAPTPAESGKKAQALARKRANSKAAASVPEPPAESRPAASRRSRATKKG